MQLSRDEYNSIKRNAKLHVSGLPADPKQIGGIPALICRTGTGGIPARSGNTAGKATDVSVVFIKPDGTLSTSGRDITVYNPFALPVGASVYITCKFVNNGYWIVDAEDCG
jgi:hypothetical protein